MSVSVVIPNWNGAANLVTVLDSLRNQTHPIAEVIMVDNGSTDNSLCVAKEAGARVIAFGSRMPDCTASENQRSNCRIGSASASVSNKPSRV